MFIAKLLKSTREGALPKEIARRMETENGVRTNNAILCSLQENSNNDSKKGFQILRHERT